MNILYFILAGIAGGVIGGMGMGGGTLLIPVLTVLLNVAQKQAQFINLSSFIPMGAVSLGIHIHNKLVDYKSGAILMIAGILSSVGAALLVGRVNSEILRFLFGVFLIEISVIELSLVVIRWVINKRKNNNLSVLT